MTGATTWTPGSRADAPAAMELPFDAEDFKRVCSMIRARAGIDLHPGKQHMVYSRLSRRVRERGERSFRSYLDALQGAGDDEWQEFVNCLTTNLTSFFREAHHFEALAQLLRSRPHAEWKLWSCACSTGEEVWSIAMTAHEALGSTTRVALDASDIDTKVLQDAQQGIYPMDSTAAIGQERLRRFFQRGTGRHAGKVRVRLELLSLPFFRQHNLLGAVAWDRGPYDAIFCRNVMIYFDRPTQRRVLERLHARLKPGGLLFVGHSENFTEHRDLVELAGKTVYRRAEGMGA